MSETNKSSSSEQKAAKPLPKVSCNINLHSRRIVFLLKAVFYFIIFFAFIKFHAISTTKRVTSPSPVRTATPPRTEITETRRARTIVL